MNPTRDANTRQLVRRFAGGDAAAAAVQQVSHDSSRMMTDHYALREATRPRLQCSRLAIR